MFAPFGPVSGAGILKTARNGRLVPKREKRAEARRSPALSRVFPPILVSQPSCPESALSFAGFGKDDAHIASRTLTLATCTGTLTLPSTKQIAGSSGRWTLLADGTTLKARHALTGCVLIFR